MPNVMQMSSNKDFRSLTLGSAHEKFKGRTRLRIAIRMEFVLGI